MRIRTYVAVGVLGICGLVATVSRVDAQSAPSAPPLFGPAPPTRPLFANPQASPNDQREPLRDVVSRLQREAQSRLGTKPKVVCGTTVIPAQPAVDPKSILKTPEGRRFTVRSVRPQMCGDNPQPPDVAPQPEPPAPDVRPAR
jgi:hypothetical protein